MMNLKILKNRARLSAIILSLPLSLLFLIRLGLIAYTGEWGFYLLGVLPVESLGLYLGHRWQLDKDPERSSFALVSTSYLWMLGLAPLFTVTCFGMAYFTKASAVEGFHTALLDSLITVPALSTLGLIGLGILSLPVLIGFGLAGTAADYFFFRRHRTELATLALYRSHNRLMKRLTDAG